MLELQHSGDELKSWTAAETIISWVEGSSNSELALSFQKEVAAAELWWDGAC